MSVHPACGYDIRPCHVCGNDRCYECDPYIPGEDCGRIGDVECSESDLGEVPDGQ